MFMFVRRLITLVVVIAAYSFLFLQLLILTSIRMCKIYHTYNIILTKILALPSTGLMLITIYPNFGSFHFTING